MAENLLKGKLGIITGALDENSIAWKAALKAHEQGAKFVLTNAPIAMRMGAIKELSDHCKTIVLPWKILRNCMWNQRNTSEAILTFCSIRSGCLQIFEKAVLMVISIMTG